MGMEKTKVLYIDHIPLVEEAVMEMGGGKDRKEMGRPPHGGSWWVFW